MSGAVDIRIIVSRSILKLCSIYNENVSTRQENFVKGANDLNFNKGDTKLVRLTYVYALLFRRFDFFL